MLSEIPLWHCGDSEFVLPAGRISPRPSRADSLSPAALGRGFCRRLAIAAAADDGIGIGLPLKTPAVKMGTVMANPVFWLLLLCVCGGDGQGTYVEKPAISGTGQQCGPAAQDFDWQRARQEYFYLSKVMSTDLGGNCAQRMEAEGRAARSPEV